MAKSARLDRNLVWEIGVVSKMKNSESICGDQCVYDKDRNGATIILSDGLGSGVKANILSTLTSTMLSTMLHGSVPLEEAAGQSADPAAAQQVQEKQVNRQGNQHRRQDDAQEIVPEAAAHAPHGRQQGEQEARETGVKLIRVPLGEHENQHRQQKAEYQQHRPDRLLHLFRLISRNSVSRSICSARPGPDRTGVRRCSAGPACPAPASAGGGQ